MKSISIIDSIFHLRVDPVPVKVSDDWGVPDNFTGAVEYPTGDKEWYKDGKLHRDGDRPAVLRANGRKRWWWVNGKFIRGQNAPAAESIFHLKPTAPEDRPLRVRVTVLGAWKHPRFDPEDETEWRDRVKQHGLKDASHFLWDTLVLKYPNMTSWIYVDDALQNQMKDLM